MGMFIGIVVIVAICVFVMKQQKQCPHCKEVVSVKATACPKCTKNI